MLALLPHYPSCFPMVQEQTCIQVISKVYPKLQSLFCYLKKISHLLSGLLILSLPSRFSLAEFAKNSIYRNFQHFAHYLHRPFQPIKMLLLVHPMSTFVFSHIQPVLIAVYTKWEFRQIMVVKSVTRDLLFAGYLAEVLIYLRQPVLEHYLLFAAQFCVFER